MLQNKISVEGAEIFYSSWGSQNADKMIFLHDNPGSSADLHPANITALSKTFHVVVFDRAGHGESSYKKIDFETTRTSILKVARAMNFESFAIMAHSWGSLFAFDFANQYPERVDSLFLINPVTFERDADLNFPVGLMKIPGMFSILRSKFEAQLVRLLKLKGYPQDLMNENKNRLSKREAISFALEEALLTQSLKDLKNVYPQIQKHVLILASKDDAYANWEQQADRLYQILPDANIVLEPSGGHSILSRESLSLQRASKLIQRHAERKLAHA